MNKEQVNKQANSNIIKYYIYLALYGLMLPNIVFTVFLVAKGLNYSQIGILESFFGVALMLGLFGGAFSDMFGRKKTVFIGMIIVAVSCFLYVISNTYLDFLIVYFIWGLGIAACSGADTALIYDSLKSAGRQKEFIKVYGKAHTFMLLAGTIGALIGSYLYAINETLPFSAGSFFILLSAIVFVTMHEKKTAAKHSIKTGYLQIKNGLTYLLWHKNIRWVLCLNMLATAYFAFFYTLQGPYLLEVGFKVTDLGWIYAIATAIEAIATYATEKIHRRFSEKNCFAMIIASYVISSAIFGYAFGFPVLIAYFFLKFGSGFGGTFVEHYLQKHSNTRIRATLSSAQGFALDIVRIITLPLLGILVDKTSIQFGLLLMTGVTLFFGIILYKTYPRHAHKFAW